MTVTPEILGPKTIVIGGDAAGLSAASKLRRLSAKSPITVYERSAFVSYGACGLPYFVGGLIPDESDLLSLSPEELQNKRGIMVFRRHEVLSIDRSKKEITVCDLEKGRIFKDQYDYLVLACGGEAIKPDLPGMNSEGIYVLKTVEDGLILREALKSTKHCLILGGGMIGLECAEALHSKGVETTIIELRERLLPGYEAHYGAIAERLLTESGIHLKLGQGLSEIRTTQQPGQGSRLHSVVLSNGEEIEVDSLIASIGVRPATALASACGLELGPRQSIAVNEHMQTSDPFIYAAGDCAHSRHLLSGEAVYTPLGTHANKQGRAAGSNLGGDEELVAPILNTQAFKLFNAYFASTGLNAYEATKLGYEIALTTISKGDIASYYPGGESGDLTLIFERQGGRLLGAQACGSKAFALRINVLVAAISCQMTVAEVNNLDLLYTPSMAPVYDPILIAASQAMKQVLPLTE